MVSISDMISTALRLPEPSIEREILGCGPHISNHIHGQWAIMRYDGSWWNECGTEVCETAPEYWAYLA
jgi:hypothetical protein